MFESLPIATHIEKSLDDTRTQVVGHLVAESIRLTNVLEQKVEQILLVNQQKLDAHMLQFSAEQQDRLNSCTQGAISEVQLQIGCLRSERDLNQRSEATNLKGIQKISALESQMATIG